MLRVLVWLLGLGVLAGAGLCAAVVVVGLALSAPRLSEIGPPPAALPGAEAVAFPAASGDSVHGWFVPGAAPLSGSVLLMHGAWGSRRQMTERARVLQAHGYAVLLIDLRGHGETGGGRITFGKMEALDAAAAVDWLHARLPRSRVGVIGVSLGGAAALLGPTPLPVDALVLESVYSDIGAALSNRLRVALGPWVGPVATPVLSAAFQTLLPPILGVTPAELRPADRIGGVTAPVLVASGDIDERTPLTEAQALFDRAPEPKQFWSVPGAAHVDLERYDTAAYWQHVLPFLDGHLRP